MGMSPRRPVGCLGTSNLSERNGRKSEGRKPLRWQNPAYRPLAFSLPAGGRDGSANTARLRVQRLGFHVAELRHRSRSHGVALATGMLDEPALSPREIANSARTLAFLRAPRDEIPKP